MMKLKQKTLTDRKLPVSMNLKVMIMLAIAVIFTLGAAAKKKTPVSRKKAAAWVARGEWKNGFDAMPDNTVNIQEFYSQYHKNRKEWDAAFKWLAETDLLSIPKGKLMIPGTNIRASIEDSSNEPLEKRKSESHRKKIDFMYVVKGTEGFYLLDHKSSVPNCPYSEEKDVIRYDYDKQKSHFFTSTPKRFVICFPSDWHIAKVQTPLNDQSLRVIVLKIDYVE